VLNNWPGKSASLNNDGTVSLDWLFLLWAKQKKSRRPVQGNLVLALAAMAVALGERRREGAASILYYPARLMETCGRRPSQSPGFRADIRFGGECRARNIESRAILFSRLKMQRKPRTEPSARTRTLE
jgi:hypothetical protein